MPFVFRIGDVLQCRRAELGADAAAVGASKSNVWGGDGFQERVSWRDMSGVLVGILGPWKVRVSRIESREVAEKEGRGGPEKQGGRERGVLGGKMRVVLENVGEGCRVLVRGRREGDKFAAPWRRSPLKVKDLLRAQKVR